MRVHRYKGKCEFCGREGEVWKLYSTKEKRWYWVCKDCKKKEQLMSLEEICNVASFL
jgi:transposase-like protein